MKRSLALIIPSLLAVAPSLAHAGAHAQCEQLDEAMQAKLHTLLANTPVRVAALCEPCGETVPDLPYSATHVTIASNLALDGKRFDLAYTYLQTSPARYENLALLVGCPVSGVSPSLRSEDAADGVLITADNAPVTPLPSPLPSIPPPSTPTPEPPVAVETHYSTTIHYSIPWLAIALASGGIGILLGAVGTLAILALRRRRAMEPRATKLRA